MRCSICGAKLKKDGDICSNCYKEFQEEEDLKKDVKEVFKIKRKYSIKYEMLKYIEIIILFALCIIVFLISGQIKDFLLTLLGLAAILGVLLFWDKRVANGTSVTFYEKKAVYRNKFIFNITKVIKYDDITNVTYYQTFRQKRMGFGDLCFYQKGAIPGMNILKFQIKNVENVIENLQKIGEIVGSLEE